ncbi:AraC family transcriptional regulator [Pandoraea captiosa]|uniref:AraC family transcriptional regulator n=1 Tax=Pandoraea captiosa TaxID=2508302 RepID=A0A5E4ZGT2_9BURK|nr:AraC family transcriptional regulator [Pandoraea captiosa]VVE60539.1 AraC family transcriptional regulator [Pandoraea captiosa]
MTASVTRKALAGRVTVRLLPAVPYSVSDPSECETLGISLTRQCGVHAINSDRRSDFDTPPAMLAYAPAGTDVFSESGEGGEYLVMRWSPGTDVGARMQVGNRIEVPGQRQALTLAFAIRRQLLAPAPDPLQSDLQPDLQLDEVVLRFLATSPALAAQERTTCRETAVVPSTILSKIHDEFSRPLALAELAAEAGQTELQFLRQFTRATGITPHAYLMEIRLQAARRMVASTDAPLAGIATECGFSHQSHMGRVFRASLGLTPQQYRRTHRRQ